MVAAARSRSSSYKHAHCSPQLRLFSLYHCDVAVRYYMYKYYMDLSNGVRNALPLNWRAQHC